MSPLQALYFSLATATTVGYGDITPLASSDPCIIFSMIQMAIMLIFVVLFFNKFVSSINEKSNL
ncbi:MAG: ion channel [Cetobacterium somerae]|uniref:ion channel n=1 Tax=Cetobacterium somerae TaxID=188913 RepID=UPI003F3BFCD5